MKTSVAVLLIAYLSVTAKAFLPRISLLSRDLRTDDHATITKKGFLKPLYYFLIENRQYLKDQYLTTFLRDIYESGSPSALKDMTENMSPQIQFLTALNEIESANVEVDSSPLNSSASAHFDGEQFESGSQRIVRLRQELITSLLKGDTLQHARNLAGGALHTLQDFYSRSNWIELGNASPYELLGRPEFESEIPQEFIAGPTESTCNDCSLDPESGLTDGLCESNLNTVKLTSGYRSGQDIEKPEFVGKCSHGGKTDESRFMSATGGINKDSTSVNESPHASLHTVAADLAVEATSIFLNDIRSTVGDDIFAKFLNLKSEKSLALVIDVSGSMSDEISEVKSVSVDFVSRTLQNGDASFTYVLVPFNDPGVGPVTVTSDAQEVIDAVNSLRASGGGDCPELGMTGLYQALLHCLPESIIYYFSDADVKDEDRRNEVLSLAIEKKVKIHFVITGRCSRRKKRQVQGSKFLRNLHRVRRSSEEQNVYQLLATETGGQVLETSKSGVADVVKLIDPGNVTNSSEVLREVELLKVKESRAQSFNRENYFVDIDTTLQSLILVFTAADAPVLEVEAAQGNSTLQKKVLSSSNKLVILEVTSLVSGSLKLIVSCTGPYTLQVSGFSSIDFTYELLEVEDLERGTSRRVVGNPLRGQTLLLILDFVGRQMKTASNLTLVGIDGTSLETFNITQGQGYYQDSYFVTFTPTAERFRLKVTGKDESGAIFQRIKPTLFTLGDVKLSLNVDNASNSNTIFPGEFIEVSVNVEISADNQTLYFTASDDLKYFESITPTSYTLGKNDTVVLRVRLSAPGDASYGLTTTVTVFASQDSGFSQVVNFMVFYVTVASKNPDLSPPTCTIVNQTGECARVYGRPECVSSMWNANVTFNDAGEGLFSITTRDNLNGTLNVGAFNQGAKNTSVPASFTSNCCYPRVRFVGLDLVGNIGTCSVSLVPDIVSLSARPNSTSVFLNPGEKTKVPFTLTNLGSEGSFSFHVTRTSELISYVMPFSLILQINTSATVHVMIKSRGVTNDVMNLTVKAVSQSSIANVKEVTLFYILVSTVVEPEVEPTLKPVLLKGEVVKDQPRLSMIPGESLEVRFKVENLASAENYTFNVLSNHSSINGVVQPASVTLKAMQAISCLLNLTSQADARPKTVTQVNVTATPASRNADTKELQVVSLTITLEESAQEDPVKNDGQKQRLEMWHIAIIASGSGLLVIVAVVVACRRKCSSCRDGKPAESKTNSGSQGFNNPEYALHLSKINQGYCSELTPGASCSKPREC
ncbi:von Willebrand factor A domain-containing protein 7-like [Montipora capricornis]|uniref:von Willebrand factor A domain-containing protein 7-like n=1 Tax=Montipora capricornis TaxID=246305 RepID=UPI0035F0FC41